MNKSHSTLNISFALIFILALTSLVQAQAPIARTYVSAASGRDTNDCSRLSPCRYFQRAVNAVAAGGEVVVLDSGGYGAVGIDKSVTLRAPIGVYAGITVQNGDAIRIHADPSDTVVIRGLTLSSLGTTSNGINYLEGGVLHVERCVISGFAGDFPAGRGIRFSAGGQLFVKDTILRNNQSLGIDLTPQRGTVTASLDHCRLEANNSGLQANDNAKVTMRDCVVAGNSGNGLTAIGNASPAEINVDNCLVTGSQFGVSTANNGIIRLSRTVVTDNSLGLFSPSGFGGTFISWGNNKINGNGTDISVNSFTVVPQD